MTALAEARPRVGLRELLVLELAPRAGRWAAVTRIAVGCSLTVAIAMLFQIPEPTYMAYIVFAISKDEKNGTVTAAVGGLVAVTLAVIVTLGLSIIDTAEPALRLPLMALATFVAMFTVRTFALGPIAYLAGFVIVTLQSLVDDARSPEALTRIVLWIWVVALVPVAVTVILNLLWGQSAAASIRHTLRQLLQELEAALAAGHFHRHLADWRGRALPLLAAMRQTAGKGRGRNAIGEPVITALLDALVMLEAVPASLPEVARQALAANVRASVQALRTGTQAAAPAGERAEAPRAGAAETPDPAVRASLKTLAQLAAAMRAAPATERLPPRAARPAIAADAFKNAAHWQFALKTTLAVMLSYVIYTLLDWPGVRTAITTCFFVALASLGETVHKLLLRLCGAALGGLIAGLCIVFVLPSLIDIGQLCLLIGVVSLGAAWVATSSERLAYGGMQIAFAFFLGILQGYAPASDLTVLRDRLVGILLGNVVITLVFTTFWPASTRDSLRAALADLLRALAAVLCRPGSAADARTHAVQALVRADHLRALSLFERRLLPAHPTPGQMLPLLDSLERLAGHAFVMTSGSLAVQAGELSLEANRRWLEGAAQRLSLGQPAPSELPPAPALAGAVAVVAGEQYAAEVRHVAAALR